MVVFFFVISSVVFSPLRSLLYFACQGTTERLATTFATSEYGVHDRMKGSM